TCQPSWRSAGRGLHPRRQQHHRGRAPSAGYGREPGSECRARPGGRRQELARPGERVRPMLIRGGEVIDGTGAPASPVDVRVRGGVIAEVGPQLRPEGHEEVIDATGAVVTPGFIDNHTHFDPSLYWDPFADPMPQHGVTSVLIGNCSLSLAPLRADH